MKYDCNPFDMGLFSEALKLQVAKCYDDKTSKSNHQMFECTPVPSQLFPSQIDIYIKCFDSKSCYALNTHKQFLTCY